MWRKKTLEAILVLTINIQREKENIRVENQKVIAEKDKELELSKQKVDKLTKWLSGIVNQ